MFHVGTKITAKWSEPGQLTAGKVYESEGHLGLGCSCRYCGKENCNWVFIIDDRGLNSCWCPEAFEQGVDIPGFGRVILKPREK